MTDLILQSKITEYLKDHPDAWTRDVHQAVAKGTKYWSFMAMMKQLASDSRNIDFKVHSNKNLTWRYHE